MKLKGNEIIDLRNHKVVKHNDSIQKARYNLSVQEQKIILYLISKIKPNDTDLHLYKFSIQEFCQVCGIDDDNGKNYADLKDAVINLRNKGFWARIGEGVQTTVSWIDKASITEKSGIIEIKLDKDMKPFLLNLRNHFTMYELYYVLAMKSKYSLRLYELLKSYEFIGKCDFDIEHLKMLLSAENYKTYKDFRVYVIDTALREINEYTDILIDYTAEKTEKKYTKIVFRIKPKKNPPVHSAIMKKIAAEL